MCRCAVLTAKGDRLNLTKKERTKKRENETLWTFALDVNHQPTRLCFLVSTGRFIGWVTGRHPTDGIVGLFALLTGGLCFCVCALERLGLGRSVYVYIVIYIVKTERLIHEGSEQDMSVIASWYMLGA